MILATLNDTALYKALGKRIEYALDFIKSQDLTSAVPGRLDIMGDDLYGVVSQYITHERTECEYEGHRKYIDLHYVIEGEEKLFWYDAAKLTPIGEYIEEKDKQRFSGTDFDAAVKLGRGVIAILYPSDAHFAGAMLADKQQVKKLVLKIKI